MKNEEFIKEIENILSKTSDEARAEAKIIIEALSNIRFVQILAGDEIKNKDEILHLAQKRTETHAPIQYLLGFSEFMGHKFIVNPDVLIPRDETEILVREVINHAKSGSKILDIGVGSGCISCILANKIEGAHVLGVDISTPALKVAIENAKNLTVPNTFTCRKSDIFSNVEEKFDIIVSNPPYVKKDYKISHEVAHEPEIALFAPDCGLYFYKKIIKEAKNHLNSCGQMFFEVGDNQAQDVSKMLQDAGFKDVQIVFDLAKIARVVFCKN